MSGIELNYEGMDNHKPYLFELGHVVMTAGLSAWAEESFPPALLSNRAWATALINAHATGVWEHMDPFDAKQNRLSIEHEQRKNDLPEGEYDPQRIFSHYTICGKKIYVITEWDRSVTTLLFPHEY